MPPMSLNKRPFHLLRWFSVLALILIVLISSIAATVLAGFLSHHILRRDAVVVMKFVNSIVQAANAKHASEPGHRSPDPEEAHKNPRTALEHYLEGHRGKLLGHQYEADAGLGEFFQTLAQMPDVLRTNIYAEDGSIAWSSDDALTGTHFRLNPDLDSAFAGEPIVHERVAGEDEKPEHNFFPEPGGRYIENYLPIWDEDNMGIAAVIELYRSPQTLFEAVNSGQRLVWISTGLAGLFLYLALFWVVQRADKTIKQQQAQLVDAETFTAIGEMASAVAHGLRNPLASVRSSADLGLEDASPSITHKVLGDIIQEVDRLEMWIRQLLTYTRPVNGEVEQVRINEVVERSLHDFTERMERQSVQLVCETRDDLPPVQANAMALGQVFNSLIANALEAMPSGGELMTTNTCTADRRSVEFSLTDTGQGIPSSQLSKIFDPFFTTKRGGLGVGLALTRRTLHRFGGTLNLTSTEGHGTSVTVRVPVARRQRIT